MITIRIEQTIESLEIIQDNLANACETKTEQDALRNLSRAIDALRDELSGREVQS